MQTLNKPYKHYNKEIMKKIFISAVLLSAMAFHANAEDLTQKSDSTKAVKIATIKKVAVNESAIDATTGKKVESPKKVEAKSAAPVVVNKPTFPGGEKAIREFVRTNMKYPKECEAERLMGRVTITMTITPDGTPTNIKMLRSSGNKFMDAEAMRIAKLMPKWQPVKDEKNAEAVNYMLPIQFRPTK